MDEIRIDNLEVYAHHGVYPEEKERGQSFFVNMVLYLNIRAAGKADELQQSVNYGEVCHFVTGWMQKNTFDLIEAVAESLAEQVLKKFPLLSQVEVEIRKPEAPIGLPFESVSVRIRRGWHHCFVAVGSNMGEREKYIRQGIEELKNQEDIRVKKVSAIIETAAYGGVEQGDFLNGVIELDTLLTPGELLALLHEIEGKAGRVRRIHWGPRTLDLDILFYDKLIYEDEQLIIPHVDLQNRIFVLKPMAELAPNFRHPVLQKTMRELEAALLQTGVGK